MVGIAAVPHQPDAPDFTREITESSADLDVVLIQKPFPGRSILQSLWESDRVEHRQPVLRRDNELESEGLQSIP